MQAQLDICYCIQVSNVLNRLHEFPQFLTEMSKFVHKHTTTNIKLITKLTVRAID